MRNNDDIYEILEDSISCYTVRPFEYKSNDYVDEMELFSIDEIVKQSEETVGEKERRRRRASVFVKARKREPEQERELETCYE